MDPCTRLSSTSADSHPRQERIIGATPRRSGDVDLDIHSCFRGNDLCSDRLTNAPDPWPTGCPEYDDRNPSIVKVLLIPEVLVGGHEHIEPLLFCGADQIAIGKLVPSAFPSGPNLNKSQKRPERNRDTLIEEDPHAAKVEAVNSRTLSTWVRSTPGNHSRNSETVAPLSRFWNKAATGTRVPRNFHAPPQTSGIRSIPGHWDHSVIR